MIRARMREGFTVIEVLVYAALSVALLGGVALYVQSGMRLFRSSEAFREVQRDAMLTLKRVAAELTNSTYAEGAGGGRVVLYPSPDQALVFASADGLVNSGSDEIWTYDPSGDLLWRKWVLFSLNEAERILEKRETGFTGRTLENLPVPPAPDDFSAEPQVYGRNVADFSVSWQAVGEVIDVALVAETSSKTGADEGTRIELRTSVHLQN